MSTSPIPGLFVILTWIDPATQSLTSSVYTHPIVSQFNILRQLLRHLFVIECMVDMRKDRAFGLKILDHLKGLAQGKMGEMWNEPDRADDQNIQVFQFPSGSIGDSATVGDVGAIIEFVA